MPNKDQVWVLKIVDPNSQEVEVTKLVHDHLQNVAAQGSHILEYIPTVNYKFTAHDVHSWKKAMVMQSYSNGALFHYLTQLGVQTEYEREIFINRCFIGLYNAFFRLQYDLGLIHRDIKTENILVNEKGECIAADYGEAISVQQALNDLLDTEMRVNVVNAGTNTRPFEVQILYGRTSVKRTQYALYLSENIHMIDLVDLVNTMVCAWNQLSPYPIRLCYAPQTNDDYRKEAKISWYKQNEQIVTSIGARWLFNRDLPKTYKELLIKFSVLAYHSGQITEPKSQRMATLLTWAHLGDSLAKVKHLLAQKTQIEQKAPIAREKAERERKERERIAREKAERERKERERIAREKAERERKERERNAREKAERERKERERNAREKAERERKERERIARGKAEKER
eukprot:310414_1